MAGQIVRIENDKTQERKNHGDSGEFLSGVMALTLSAAIVKIIGLIYKIPMLRLLGSEGMGYFNSAYEIYALFCTVSTAGLPVAMSVMISRCRGREGARERIFKVSLSLFVSLGIVGTLLMMILAYPLSVFLGGGKCLFSILAISPTVFFICATSAYRGYYQGQGKMLPTALSQVIEALGKLLLGILFACIALYCGYATETVAAFAVLGILVGSAMSTLYLWIIKRQKKSEATHLQGGNGRILRSLLKTAIPVTLSAAVVSITKMVDMTMILRRLQSLGHTSEAAFSAYGCYTTLAVPLFGIAPAFVSSVALPLIPRLGSAISDRDGDRQIDTVNEGLRLTCLISMPIGVGLSLYSREILELIFSGQHAEIDLAAPLLSVLGMSVALSCLVTVTNSILHTYGKSHIPTVAMTVGACIKIVLAYFLIGTPNIGIMGAPISTLACDLVINLVNFYFIVKSLPGELDIGRSFLRPFAAAALSCAFAKFIYGAVVARIGESALLTVAAISLCGMIYAVLCFALGVISIDEIRKMRRMNADKIYN